MEWNGMTRPSGLPYGSGRRSTPFTSAKIATAAPMPITSVSEAVSVKAGLRRRDLQAGRTTDESDISWRLQVSTRAYGRDLGPVSTARPPAQVPEPPRARTAFACRAGD